MHRLEENPFQSLQPAARARLLRAHRQRACVVYVLVTAFMLGIGFLAREVPKVPYVLVAAWLAYGVVLVRGHRQLAEVMAAAGGDGETGA